MTEESKMYASATSTQSLDAAVESMNDMIHALLPNSSSEEVALVRVKVMEHIAQMLNQGYTLAFLKKEGKESTVQTLRLVKNEVH